MAKPGEANEFTEQDGPGDSLEYLHYRPRTAEALTDFDYQAVGDYDDLDIEETQADDLAPMGEEQDIHGCPLFEMGRFVVLEDDPERDRVFGGYLELPQASTSEYSPDGITLLPESFKAGTQIIILEPDVKSGRYKRTNYSY